MQQWDADNRAVAMTNTTTGGRVAFVYDGDGKRVKKVDNGITTTVYVGTLFEVNVTTGVTTTYYFANGKRIAVRTGAGLYYLHGDHLGSHSLTTSITGTEAARTRYYPYGGTRTASGTPQTDRLFTDQRAESGALGALYDYGARHYDSALARFLSPDSIVPGAGNPQALNRYSYVLNAPLKYTDPSGHCPWRTICDYQWRSAFPSVKGGIGRAALTVGLSVAADGVKDTLIDAGASWVMQEEYDPASGLVTNIVLNVVTAGFAPGSKSFHLAQNIFEKVGKSVRELTDSGTKWAKSKTAVIGHYKQGAGYTARGDAEKWTYLNVHHDLYRQLTPEEFREVNKMFLDDAIREGKEFVMDTPWDEMVKVDNDYKWEVEYLLNNGYRWVEENGIEKLVPK